LESAHPSAALATLQKGAFAEAQAAFTALAQSAAASGFQHRANGYAFLASTAAAYHAAPPLTWDGTILMEEK
jgi:hypothetical protein